MSEIWRGNFLNWLSTHVHKSTLNSHRNCVHFSETFWNWNATSTSIRNHFDNPDYE